MEKRKIACSVKLLKESEVFSLCSVRSKGQALQVKYQAKWVSARTSGFPINRALLEQDEGNNEKTPLCHSKSGWKQIYFDSRKYFNRGFEMLLKYIKNIVVIGKYHVSEKTCLDAEK